MSGRHFCVALFAIVLTACATTPEAPVPARAGLEDFSLDARFALRVSTPGDSPQSSSGRLSWTHVGETDQVLIASPLGVGLAEIEIGPRLARLRTGDAQVRESSDPEALLAEVTGQALPVRQLPGWLLARPGAEIVPERDALGRPLRFRENGWRVEYAYGDDATDALPNRLTLNLDEAVELRLRIENWKALP